MRGEGLAEELRGPGLIENEDPFSRLLMLDDAGRRPMSHHGIGQSSRRRGDADSAALTLKASCTSKRWLQL